MRIEINYDSCWRNSFLDGNNNEFLPKKGRKFIGSITELKKPGNFKPQKITHDTVMGILNRLIGDQRKLYQSRKDDNYYFKDIDYPDTAKILFKDNPIQTEEMTFIRNITGSEDQNSFTGAIKTDDAIFNSDYSAQFWSVLALDFEQLCQFIISNDEVSTTIALDPISISKRFEQLQKATPEKNDGLAKKAWQVLKNSFDGKYLNGKDKIIPIKFYCSSLYLQLDRLSEQFDMTSAKTKAGVISGISKNGSFTKKDFMVRFTTGKKKKIWGNPYIYEEFIKGEGKTKHLMTKASGTLEINLAIDRDKAKEIKSMIENAGVSSFYLGKKGLAYVSKDISTREMI